MGRISSLLGLPWRLVLAVLLVSEWLPSPAEVAWSVMRWLPSPAEATWLATLPAL